MRADKCDNVQLSGKCKVIYFVFIYPKIYNQSCFSFGKMFFEPITGASFALVTWVGQLG